MAKKRQGVIEPKDRKTRHPEEAEGEIFIGNIGSLTCYTHIGWKTKRRGKVAYEKDNATVIRNIKTFPVFIKKQEALEKCAENASHGINNPRWLVRMLET
jgi:hypothetical protein